MGTFIGMYTLLWLCMLAAYSCAVSFSPPPLSLFSLPPLSLSLPPLSLPLSSLCSPLYLSICVFSYRSIQPSCKCRSIHPSVSPSESVYPSVLTVFQSVLSVCLHIKLNDPFLRTEANLTNGTRTIFKSLYQLALDGCCY